MILAIFGDFRVFDMTSLMTSLWSHTRYVCTFFGTNGLGRVIAIHEYHTLDVSSIGFQDLGGVESAPPPPAVRWVQKARLFLGLKYFLDFIKRVLLKLSNFNFCIYLQLFYKKN